MSTWTYPEYFPDDTLWDYLRNIANTGLTSANQAITDIQGTAIPDGLTLQDMTGIDPSITLPTMPAEPDVTVTDYGAVKPSAPTLTMDTVATDADLISIIGGMKAELQARLAGTSSIEAQIFGNFKDKVTAEASDAYDKAKDSLAADGFSRPTGAQLIVFENFGKDAVAQISDAARQTAIYLYEDTHKTLGELQALESSLITAKAGDESNKIRLYEVDMDAYINLVKLGYEMATMRVEIYKGQVEAFAAVVRARAEEAGYLISKFNAINEANKMLLDFAVSRMGAIVEKSKAAGSIAGQIAATALNGMNLSTSFSYSQSKSEGHSFDG